MGVFTVVGIRYTPADSTEPRPEVGTGGGALDRPAGPCYGLAASGAPAAAPSGDPREEARAETSERAETNESRPIWFFG
jgi:hypothetical protein